MNTYVILASYMGLLIVIGSIWLKEIKKLKREVKRLNLEKENLEIKLGYMYKNINETLDYIKDKLNSPTKPTSIKNVSNDDVSKNNQENLN